MNFGMPMSGGMAGSMGASVGNPMQNVMMTIIRKLIETNPEYLSSGIPNDLIQKLMGSQLMYSKPTYTVSFPYILHVII